MFALVDCNNFYASCQRVFEPHLIGKPVVILSNNDGCAVARRMIVTDQLCFLCFSYGGGFKHLIIAYHLAVLLACPTLIQ